MNAHPLEIGQRISVVGTSGCGKTTLARQLGELLAIPHFEIDNFTWRSNWTEAPLDEVRAQLSEVLSAEAWVIDGNYGKLRDILWARVQTVIFLDYSRPVIFRRVLFRTVKRVFMREKLWDAGNQESFKKAFLSKDSVIVWSWTTYHRRRSAYPELFARPEYAHLVVLRFTHPRQTARWVESLKMYQQEKTANV